MGKIEGKGSQPRKETRGRIWIEWGIDHEWRGKVGTLLRVYMLEAGEAMLQFTKRQKR